MSLDQVNVSAPSHVWRSALGFCPRSNPLNETCIPFELELIGHFINGFTVLLNVVHLLILLRLKQLRGTTYGFILFSFTVSDVVFAVMVMIKMNCRMHDYITRDRLQGFLTIQLSEPLQLCKYMLIIYAALERFIAIRLPFRYNSTLVIKKPAVWIISSWGLAQAGLLLRDYFSYDDICIEPLIGVNNADSFRPSCINMTAKITLAIAVICLLIPVWLELRRMAKSSVQTESDSQLQNASRYIILVTITFYGCFGLLILDGVLTTIGKSSTTYKVWALYVHCTFGMWNTFIYGWMSDGYRQQVKLVYQQYTGMFRRLRLTRVVPITFPEQKRDATIV